MYLHRLDGENEPQYIWRLCSAKDDGRLEMTWPELGNMFNSELGLQNTESAYRKLYQAVKRFMDAGVFKENKYTDDLEERKRQLEAERQKLFATKTEYNRLLRQTSRQELFYQNIADSIQRLTPPEFPVNFDCLDWYPTNGREYILTISDIHAGANFKTDTNEYSLEEVGHRFRVLAEKLSAYVRAEDVEILKVVCLGDTIQGILRVSDLQLNETSVVEATVFISQMLQAFLNTLSAFCKVEYYHVPSANHTQIRPLGTKASELKNEDIEYIIGNYIRDVLADNGRVTVHLDFDHEYIEIPIHDDMAIAMHGHQIKDVRGALKDLSYKNKKFYLAVFLGHYHSAGRNIVGEHGDKDAEVIVCPSFIGTDPYSDGLMLGAKPACGLYVFDRNDGLVQTNKFMLN